MQPPRPRSLSPSPRGSTAVRTATQWQCWSCKTSVCGFLKTRSKLCNNPVDYFNPSLFDAVPSNMQMYVVGLMLALNVVVSRVYRITSSAYWASVLSQPGDWLNLTHCCGLEWLFNSPSRFVVDLDHTTCVLPNGTIAVARMLTNQLICPCLPTVGQQSTDGDRSQADCYNFSAHRLVNGSCAALVACPPGTRTRRVFGTPQSCVFRPRVQVALLEETACEGSVLAAVLSRTRVRRPALPGLPRLQPHLHPLRGAVCGLPWYLSGPMSRGHAAP